MIFKYSEYLHSPSRKWEPRSSFPEGEKKGVQQVRVLDKRYDIDVYSLVKSGRIPSSEEVGPQEDIFKNAC